MPIRVAPPKSFTPCPKGQYAAVCADVVDLGMQDSGFVDEKTNKPKIVHKIEIVWQVDAKMEDGRPFIVSQRYSLTFADFPKPSNLRTLVDAWGIDLQDLIDDTNQYDVEQLIGRTCLLNVTHRASLKKPENVFANVASLMPLPRGMVAPEVNGYVRRENRKPEATAFPSDHEGQDFPFDDAEDPGPEA